MKRFLSLLISHAICLTVAFGQDLPIDPQVTYGKLPNGLSYYILYSPRPAYKTNFYLINNTGSTVEEDDERGFAHFTEHSAFNGTKLYPGKSLINTLERHGLRFGYDVNANTGYDATVYNISNVDMSQGDEMIDTCLLMLKEIACNLTLDDASVDNERKIILEEWRRGADAFERYTRRALPLFFGAENRYATRQPIGQPEIIAGFPPEKLRNFYRKWYQPQHQAVVVIGYVRPKEVEAAISRIWRDAGVPAQPSERVWQQIDDHKGIKASAFTDMQFPGCQMDFWWKLALPPRGERNRLEYVLDCYVGTVAYMIMQNRMADIIHEPDSPWTGAAADYDQYYFSDCKDGFRLYALYDVARREEALSRLIAEAKRASEFGVTADEMEVTKQVLRKNAKKSAQDISEKNNDDLFVRVSEHFLKTNPVMPPDFESETLCNFLDTLSLTTVGSFLSKVLRPDNLSVMIAEKSAFDADSLARGLDAKIDSIWNEIEVGPLADNNLMSRPLMADPPKGGAILKSSEFKGIPARKYLLSNGACVILCKSNVLSDEIEFRAVRRGGYTALFRYGFAEAVLADILADIGGIGDFSANELRKRLAATKIDITTTYNPYTEVISAECGADEIEEMLQLVNMRMASVREDSVAFENWRKSTIGLLNDRLNTPDGVFSDSIRSVLYGHDKIALRRVSPADVDTVSYRRALDIVRQRLSGPTHYTYILTGDFNCDSISPLIAKYIGSLPASDAAPSDSIVKVDRLAVPGVRRVDFSVVMPTPTARVYMAYEIHRTYMVKDEMTVEVLANILDKKLLESLRTEAGATYGADTGGSSGEVDGYHSLFVTFDCDPEKADSMVAIVEQELRNLAQEGPDAEMFGTIHDYLIEEKYVSTLQQHYPMEYFTHAVLYGNNNVADHVPEMTRVSRRNVQSMASDMSNAPVRVTIVMRSAQGR